jgi:hypothetical protein
LNGQGVNKPTRVCKVLVKNRFGLGTGKYKCAKQS